MSIPRSPLLHKVEWGAKRVLEGEKNILSRPPHPQEETGPVRTGQEVQRKTPQTTSYIGMECSCQYGHGWLTSGTIYLAAKTIRQVSLARGGYLGANGLLHLQAEAAK